MKPLALLLAVCGLAPAQTLWTSTWSGNLSPLAGIRFETRTEPPSPALAFIGSSSGRASYSPQGSYTATHRYFHDDTNLAYAGYDVLLEQDSQPDTFRIVFLELGIGPLDFAIGRSGVVRPAEWKKLPPPVLPQPRVVHVGDRIELQVWTDPNTGQKLVDVLQIQQSPQAPGNPGIVRSSIMAPQRVAPVVPTVAGTARDFHAEDAEMRLLQPRVTVNGTPVGSSLRGGQGATGTLVWFYLPQRGRYILSLTPRPDLGFARVGEVRGGAIQFKMEGDEFVLETYTPIAPGSAPYILYVLHDREWEPTSRNQVSQSLTGSVSPAELLVLLKK